MATVTPVANAADIEAVEAVLKEVFVSDVLESQLNEDVVALDFFEETTEYTNSDGLYAVVPLKVGRTGGIGARAIGQQLQQPDHQKPDRAQYNYKNLYATIGVEGPVVARMSTNRQSAVREVEFEVTGAIQDFKRDFCRQLHTFGDGVVTLAGLPGNASSTTIPLGASNFPVIERGWLYEGLPVDFGTAANPQASGGGQRIVDIDDTPSAPALELESATAVTATHHVSIYGNRIANASNEINGLGVIVDDASTLGGIDPTAVGKRYWKSVVEANGGTLRALSLPLMNTVNRKVRQKGGRVSDVLGDYALQQKYYELLQSQVRFAGDAKLAAGAVEGPQFNNVTFVGDPDCLPNRVYFLQKKALQMFSAGDIAWQNQTTGGNILAWRQDYDMFVARAAKYCQAGTNRRPSFGLLDDISES
jgi:hypothetical protein